MRPFEFAEESETGNILCKFFPVDSNMITDEEAMRTWNSSEYRQCILDRDKLDTVITEALQKLEEDPPLPSLELEEQVPEPFFIAPVGERRDAICAVDITDDKMQVELIITAAHGGRHIETTEVKDLLVENRVEHGVEFQWISRLVNEAQRAEPGAEVRGIVAEGTPPAAGIPSQFEFLVVPFEDRILQPQSRDDGTLDMHNLGDIEVVDENQPLVRRIPSKPGEPGADVFGTTLLSEALKDTPFDVGDGVQVSPEDPHLLMATRHGVPLKLMNGMKVDEVLVVRDVDLNTGNVEYDGSVMIKGDIKNGMCVNATNDVYVNGFIENARIEALGNVVIKQGVIGKPEVIKSGKGAEAADACYIKGKNIMARYAQNAFLEAEDKIELGAQLLHCQVLGCRELHVGDEGKRKAKLVGGVANVGEAVYVGVLGSIASTTTELNFGYYAEPINEEIVEIQNKIDEKLEMIDGLVDAILLLKKQPPSQELIEKVRKAQNTVNTFREETDNLIKQVEVKQDDIDVIKKKCRLNIYGIAYPNVEFRFLDIDYKLKEERKTSSIGIVNDRWCTL